MDNVTILSKKITNTLLFEIVSLLDTTMELNSIFTRYYYGAKDKGPLQKYWSTVSKLFSDIDMV